MGLVEKDILEEIRQKELEVKKLGENIRELEQKELEAKKLEGSIRELELKKLELEKEKIIREKVELQQSIIEAKEHKETKPYGMSLEEMRKMHERIAKEEQERKEMLQEIHRQWLKDQGLTPLEPKNNGKDNFFGKCNHPNDMENGPAFILYLIVMIGGSIFNDRWLLWIVATIVYLRWLIKHN